MAWWVKRHEGGGGFKGINFSDSLRLLALIKSVQSRPPGEFVIKQIGQAALQRKRDRKTPRVGLLFRISFFLP